MKACTSNTAITLLKSQMKLSTELLSVCILLKQRPVPQQMLPHSSEEGAIFTNTSRLPPHTSPEQSDPHSQRPRQGTRPHVRARPFQALKASPPHTYSQQPHASHTVEVAFLQSSSRPWATTCRGCQVLTPDHGILPEEATGQRKQQQTGWLSSGPACSGATGWQQLGGCCWCPHHIHC